MGARLAELLEGFVSVREEDDRAIMGLAMDSRRVRSGDLFLACAGVSGEGLRYVADAVRAGAVAVVYQGDGPAPTNEVPAYALADLPHIAGAIAERYYGNPSSALRVIGVTGTNGKTSVTQFLAQALGEQTPCAIVGTLGNGYYGRLEIATHTTPDAVTLHGLLARFRDSGAKAVAMEVSSHALDQGRADGVLFDTAVFTNLSRDHLDYHRDIAAYGAAKARLFARPGLRHAIINSDDAFGARLLATLPAQVNAVSYALNATHGAREHIAGQILSADLDGLVLRVHTPWGYGELRTRLLARFNAANLLAVLGVLLVGGMRLEDALHRLSDVEAVPGRMQCFGGAGRPLVVVDYAHTPDALEQALRALREHCRGRLWAVFGCGGDRDRGKRPLMGAVAQQYADRVVLTHDNPRTENPDAILADIVAGLRDADAAKLIPDRARAIDYAVAHAEAGDAVLVAGKGHENYQLIGETRLSFSDAEHVRAALERRSA